jgi:hypothetical protein
MDLVKADAFLKVKGRVDAYNGRVQLKLDKVRFATDEEVGDLSRFFPVSPRPVPEMLAELDALVASVGDPWIRRLLEELLVKDAALREALDRDMDGARLLVQLLGDEPGARLPGSDATLATVQHAAAKALQAALNEVVSALENTADLPEKISRRQGGEIENPFL